MQCIGYLKCELAKDNNLLLYSTLDKQKNSHENQKTIFEINLFRHNMRVCNVKRESEIYIYIHNERVYMYVYILRYSSSSVIVALFRMQTRSPYILCVFCVDDDAFKSNSICALCVYETVKNQLSC